MSTDLAGRYAKAEALLAHNLKKLVHSQQVRPNWIRDTETFWYRNQTAEGVRFVLVDAEAGTQRPAFDHERLAQALGAVLDKEVDPAQLPFFGIELTDDVVRVVDGEQRIEISLDTYAATILGPAHGSETRSPDGRWSVGVRDHNLYLRDTATNEERQLTSDGAEAYSYGTPPDSTANRVMQENLGFTTPPLVVWSPDSTRFVTHRLDQRDLELMHLVRSAPAGGGRPTPMTYRYAMVGEENVATADFFVFDARTGQATQAKSEPVRMDYLSAIAIGHVWWNAGSTTVYWLSAGRGGRTARLHEFDPATGEVTVLVEETSDTNVLHGPQFYDRNVKVLDSGEVLWWSERTGWGQLYRYAADGTVSTVTSGDWLARTVVGVDEQNRRVVFTAAGREPGADLYVQGLYSVSLDGGEITAIASDGLDHDPRPSRSGRFFVDVMSRVDVPAVSVLRDATGAVVLELERADATALYAAGWSPPERVVVKAADGVTDLYCAIYKPHDFDPSKTYPVLDEIYPGPQVSTTPIRFPLSGGVLTAERHAAPFAALGFVVVAVDARGTAMRHRAFQDHARLGGDGEFVADHVAAIKQLGQTRPWLDLDRVGIYGHSGGGYASTRSMLLAPDFFKVAVSSAGDHDDATYHAWWGERFFGLPDEFDYGPHANAADVGNLQGKLLLAHGAMDDNVTPHLTMRLVDALIDANKDFDLFIVPNADHSMFHQQAYWLRRRWDYFVRHLMGETPPSYRIADVPVDPEVIAAYMG
ncbi:S9 family peptidase [Jiangella alkaliphila]|uniref:Dipeptidyl aminopeptidase/acylaminoacyl peptidase n=1 Tax=Jiangella alkaliphila TaxID=419479 RepID=A0A1H2ISI0_9ACTN|nr:DPP IV N-terminal domain-containing protein [Jiangella alkaliphila]SDU47120.1 Dipeptidyl aminopeptidase/acylaminoacyl peptidase [Jiangella alkaliphila]